MSNLRKRGEFVTPPQNRIKDPKSERIFNVVNVIIMCILIIAMVYPFWYVVMYSISDPKLALLGGPFLKPSGFSLESYKVVFNNDSIWYGFKTSIIVTTCGAVLGTLVTALSAYPLTKKALPGYKLFSFLFIFTMFFGGGLVPEYLLMKNLGLVNTYFALFLPGCVGVWNLIIMKNFFMGIPESLEESARIDGASDVTIFFKIVLPLSKPVLATISLFLAVTYWNDFFASVIYINDKTKWSLQAVLREIITNTSEAMAKQGINVQNTNNAISSKTITMATIMVSTIPILIVYPFVQKYFVKGTMIGSVKG